LGDTKGLARPLDSLAKNLFRMFVHADEFEMEQNKNVNYSLRFAQYTGVFYVGLLDLHASEITLHKRRAAQACRC
ncbi:MAG: hypothetical protein MR855_06290, partial [Collinsella sp.]|nr:hypothetical protein [Collinsella sp.]